MGEHSMNYRYNSKNEPKNEEAINYILQFSYGDTIPQEKLSDILGFDLSDEKQKIKFKQRMAKIKNYLVDKGYVLRTITGRGYYIMKPKQISGYCYHTYICKLDNLLNKSKRVLEHVDKSELSNERKKEHGEVGQLNGELKDNVYYTIYGSEYYRNKDIYDNLDD